jgi:hypothetical protein
MLKSLNYVIKKFINPLPLSSKIMLKFLNNVLIKFINPLPLTPRGHGGLTMTYMYSSYVHQHTQCPVGRGWVYSHLYS